MHQIRFSCAATTHYHLRDNGWQVLIMRAISICGRRTRKEQKSTPCSAVTQELPTSGHGVHTGSPLGPDGKRLVTIARDRTVQLWDVDTGTEIAELPLNAPPKRGTYRGHDMGIAFSPRGDVIAGAQWGEIALWDATDGKTLRTLAQPDGNQRPITLSFSPCGKYLVSGFVVAERVKTDAYPLVGGCKWGESPHLLWTHYRCPVHRFFT